MSTFWKISIGIICGIITTIITLLVIDMYKKKYPKINIPDNDDNSNIKPNEDVNFHENLMTDLDKLKEDEYKEDKKPTIENDIILSKEDIETIENAQLTYNNSDAKEYIVLRDISAGMISPGVPNIVVHKDEIIKGVIDKQFFMNDWYYGIAVEKENGKVFIDKAYLEQIIAL